jgi:hypothetical protein
MRVIVAGARRARQGIGAFVAQALVDAGCEVVGVVGRTDETSADAARALNSTPYTDLREAIEKQQPELVFIGTPIALHAEQLAIVAAAGCHCLCDKPLMKPPFDESIIDAFGTKHLALLTQWPHVIPAYHSLFPEHGPLREFFMRLSPRTDAILESRILESHILESMSHPLSVLESFVGPREATDIRIRLPRIKFRYSGIDCEVRLEPSDDRAASIGTNGRIAHRVIEPGHKMFLANDDRRVPLPDPMPLRVTEVLADIRAGKPTNKRSLVMGMQNLVRFLV